MSLKSPCLVQTDILVVCCRSVEFCLLQRKATSLLTQKELPVLFGLCLSSCAPLVKIASSHLIREVLLASKPAEYFFFVICCNTGLF